jgi:hypothetical protein
LDAAFKERLQGKGRPYLMQVENQFEEGAPVYRLGLGLGNLEKFSGVFIIECRCWISRNSFCG